MHASHPAVEGTTTDGHPFTAMTLACLIGASLPTPAACQEAVALLRAACDGGASRDTLWRLAGIAVWEGIPAARAALGVALGQPQRYAASPAATDDHIVFADLDDEDSGPVAPVTPAASQAQRDEQLPLFDF